MWRALLLVVVLIGGCCSSRVITARHYAVTRVVDGDTLMVVYDGEPTRLRLQDIDAPELKAPGGIESKQAMARLVEGKVIEIAFVDPKGKRDAFGRLLATVKVDGRDVGKQMVEAGFARFRQ